MLLEEEMISYEEEEHDMDENHHNTPPPSSSSSSSGITKEKFIEILSRDEDEVDEVHQQDYSYVLSALVITTEPTLAKLACQAIDKCCNRNSSWVIPSCSALSSLLTSTPDRSVKISCAQALNRIVKLSSIDGSTIATLMTLLQIAIACNSSDHLLTRPLQEGLDLLKRSENDSAVTEKDSRHDDEQSATDHGSSSKRGYTFDLPSDNSIIVTEEQLRSLGTVQQHLWKALRFKIQRFFVPNVTTPQKLELHSFMTPIQLQGLMRLSGFTSNSDTDFFTKHHWDQLVETVDRIYDGKESRLESYREPERQHSTNDHSSNKPRAPPPPAPKERYTPPDSTVDPAAAAYPKYLILQGVPSSHADPLDIYDFMKANNILFGIDKRDIQVTAPANPKADHTASVRFHSHEDATEAYNKINNTMYYNQKILYADYSMTNPARVLFMYKIIRYVTKESLAEGLKAYCKQGTVEKVDLPMNSSFGYITLTEIDDAIRVYRSLLKSPEGGLWVPVADSDCGEQVLVFFKYSKFPDPPRTDPEKNFSSGGPKNLCILRVTSLHEHDLTDLESICKRAGECNRLNILKGSAVYQFKYADCAQQAMVSIQNALKTVQVSLLDLSEYRQGNSDEFQDRGTGGYDPSKARSIPSDRSGGRGRGRGRDDRRRDDRYDDSRRADDRRYDSRRNDDSRRYDRNDRDRSEKNYNRQDSGRRADDVEVDYNYEDERSGDNEERTPRVERSGGDHWGRDHDEDENGHQEYHHRRSRWGDDEEGADSDRDGRRGRHDDREEDTRKRARSPSHDDHDDRRTKPAMYDQRTWERENVQAQYNRSRGRGGRGRGFSRHDTYR